MRWSFKPRKSPAPTDADIVRELAGKHLPSADAEAWLALLRPAIHLVPSSGDAAPVARLGGLPHLAETEPWPTWAGHGPLSYVGELLCDRVAAFSLDIEVPTSGRLLFFYFDGAYDNAAATVGTWDAETMAGARVVHTSDVSDKPCPVPAGTSIYPERTYEGRAIMTAPGPEHPDLAAAFMQPGQDFRSFLDHPVNSDDFIDALHERHPSPLHQVGGYAEPIQGPVEQEVALVVVGDGDRDGVTFGDSRLDDEARHWELLLQVDSDDDLDMMWGDVGRLYWLTRTTGPGSLAERTSFTWQCG